MQLIPDINFTCICSVFNNTCHVPHRLDWYMSRHCHGITYSAIHYFIISLLQIISAFKEGETKEIEALYEKSEKQKFIRDYVQIHTFVLADHK